LILNPIKRTKKIAIFASYRKNLDKAIDLTLCELKKKGFYIIYVSNESMSKDFIFQLKAKADIVIQRGNYGRCIAAYKTAYLYLYEKKFYGAKDILFLNDTIIFPVQNTNFFWKDLDRSKADIIGIFESNEISYHLQSYFLYCKNNIFLNQNFYNFWIKYIPFNSKQLIIKHGEIGFSEMLIDSGIKIYSFINEYKLREMVNNKKVWIDKYSILYSWVGRLDPLIDMLNLYSNPSHVYALLSVKFLHLPILKTDLISAGTFEKKEIVSFFKTFKTTAKEDMILSSFKIKPKNKSFIYYIKSYMGMI
jgi:lipopolysaccharide biosynthesis protein